MSSQFPIAYIDIRVFANATEDLEKVLAAVRRTLPSEFVDSIVFAKSNLTGHHGNPIVLFEARIKERKITQAVFGKLSSGLRVMDKEVLNEEIGQHLENGNLYLRVDKQSAYLNELKLSPVDPIHLRIHFKKHRSEEIVAVCKEFGLLP